jgi:hypothetical protein
MQFNQARRDLDHERQSKGLTSQPLCRSGSIAICELCKGSLVRCSRFFLPGLARLPDSGHSAHHFREMAVLAFAYSSPFSDFDLPEPHSVVYFRDLAYFL